MYLARLTRPDLLFSVSYLATRAANPTIEDSKNLQRVLDYLAGTPTLGLAIIRQRSLKPTIMADASYGLHQDGKSHSGILLMMGGLIASKSAKQRIVTLSSTEAELMALKQACTYATYFRQFLDELNLCRGMPITVLQDNKSAMIIALHGGNFDRTKHMCVAQGFIKELIDKNLVSLEHRSTENMTADIFTKPLPPHLFEHHCRALNLRK